MLVKKVKFRFCRALGRLYKELQNVRKHRMQSALLKQHNSLDEDGVNHGFLLLSQLQPMKYL